MKQAGSRAAPARMNSQSSWVSASVQTQAGANSPFSDVGFAAVFDTSAEALLVINAKGIIQRANHRAGELLRCNEEGLRQAELGKYISPPAAEEFSRLCALQAGSHAISNVAGLLASGFPVRISFLAVLSGAQNLLLCLEEGSVVQRAEGK